jgi:hypothetical protein
MTYFFKSLEAALNQVYNNNVYIILFGDFNINYHGDNRNKKALNSLLASYNLYSIINFPTRTYNNLHNIIDNSFINKYRNENFLVSALINGLSGHDAQVLSLSNIIVPEDRKELYSNRIISKNSLNEFQISLSYEA